MLLREYAIKWWFVVPPLLSNGETWNPGNCLFKSCCIPCLENYTTAATSEVPETCCRLAEWSLLRIEQCEEARHRSWMPAALSELATFYPSLIVSVAVSKLSCSSLSWGWKWTAGTGMLSVEDNSRLWDGVQHEWNNNFRFTFLQVVQRH